MSTTTIEKTEQRNHAQDQARAQLESIVQMVRQLERDTAADDWVESLTDAGVMRLCNDHGLIEPEDTAKNVQIEAYRERLIGGLQNEAIDLDDFEWDEDDARTAIMEDALEVSYRSGWSNDPKNLQAEEAYILLCTGGPACRILCDVNYHGELERPRLEYQDWGTPWTELFDISPRDREALSTYIGFFSVG